jgi:coenzyme F420-reducing hydrogenase beta subunit
MNAVTTTGVATRLAEYFYEKGYNVCGVRYDCDRDATRHDIAISRSDILEFSGSKYIPSTTSAAFERILEDDKPSMVFGLPCQIHGLNNVLERRQSADRCILVDFFCAGMLSKNLWDKHLDYLRRRCSITKIKHINFKDKTQGWRKSSLKVTDEDGHEYRQNRFNDMFYAFILRRVPYQEACYSCAFRKQVVSSDIRLGDFWGPTFKAWDDGVELVALMSDKGRKAWSEIRDYFSYRTCTEQDMYASQESGAMNSRVEKPEDYEQILTALSTDQPMEEIFRALQIARRPIGG